VVIEMKKTISSLAFIGYILFTFNTYAASLTDNEKMQLVNEVEQMYRKFEKGDSASLIAKTHASLVAKMGGIEKFIETMTVAAQLLEEQGVDFVSSDVKAPTRLYNAGDEEVGFLERVSTMSVQGQKIRSVGYIVAIRSEGSSKWFFLDGSGMREDPQSLWGLLPDLEKNITLPANYLEIIE